MIYTILVDGQTLLQKDIVPVSRFVGLFVPIIEIGGSGVRLRAGVAFHPYICRVCEKRSLRDYLTIRRVVLALQIEVIILDALFWF